MDDMKAPKDIGEKTLEVREYAIGKPGYQDVATYDERRYAGPANVYKQKVMANAYKKLIGCLKGQRILDVGCGTGRGVVEFAQEAQFATGSDASPDMLIFAASKAASLPNCTFVCAYAQHLPFRDATFDVVTGLNFLHLFSLETQRIMVADMKRVAKPGGILVLEFDNALHGLGLGLYKRWSGIELGSLPGEIRYVIGGKCRVVKKYGAVFPAIWRLFYHFPRIFVPLEKLAHLPLFNHLSHRVYYKIVKDT